MIGKHKELHAIDKAFHQGIQQFQDGLGMPSGREYGKQCGWLAAQEMAQVKSRWLTEARQNANPVAKFGQLVNAIVNADCELRISNFGDLGIAIQTLCRYWNENQQAFEVFDGKTEAYLQLCDVMRLLESDRALPLVQLIDTIDSLVWATRDLEKYCGIETNDN